MNHKCECGSSEPLYAKGLCRKCWNKKYYESHKEKAKKYYEKYHIQHPEKRKELKNKNYQRETCEIIKQISKREDPEHLTTEFIKKIVKVDCKR